MLEVFDLVFFFFLIIFLKKKNPFICNFIVVAGNVGNAFTIDPTLGTIKTSKELDRNRIPEYVLVVQASDGGSPEMSARVHVQILVTIADSAPPK
jgi:protocadherin Fat 1/2/3